jgi:hypothetical protein
VLVALVFLGVFYESRAYASAPAAAADGTLATLRILASAGLALLGVASSPARSSKTAR